MPTKELGPKDWFEKIMRPERLDNSNLIVYDNCINDLYNIYNNCINDLQKDFLIQTLNLI